MKLFKTYRPDKVITSSGTPSPDNKAFSIIFDNVHIDLDGDRPDLSDTVTFTFHIDTEITDSRATILADLRYVVDKSANSIAKVVFLGAESLHSDDLLFGSVLKSEFKTVSIPCPGRAIAAGTPFTFTVAIFGQRVSRSELVKISIQSLDIRIA